MFFKIACLNETLACVASCCFYRLRVKYIYLINFQLTCILKSCVCCAKLNLLYVISPFIRSNI